MEGPSRESHSALKLHSSYIAQDTLGFLVFLLLRSSTILGHLSAQPGLTQAKLVRQVVGPRLTSTRGGLCSSLPFLCARWGGRQKVADAGEAVVSLHMWVMEGTSPGEAHDIATLVSASDSGQGVGSDSIPRFGRSPPGEGAGTAWDCCSVRIGPKTNGFGSHFILSSGPFRPASLCLFLYWQGSHSPSDIAKRPRQ